MTVDAPIRLVRQPAVSLDRGPEVWAGDVGYQLGEDAVFGRGPLFALVFGLRVAGLGLGLSLALAGYCDHLPSRP